MKQTRQILSRIPSRSTMNLRCSFWTSSVATPKPTRISVLPNTNQAHLTARNFSRVQCTKRDSFRTQNNFTKLTVGPAINPIIRPTINPNIRRFCSSIDTSKLFVAVSDLEAKYDIKLKSFPRIVVVGPQSSGKSSVIESICGESILPKAMKMATMKPMHLTTIRSSEKKFQVGNKELRNIYETTDEIKRLNSNNYVEKLDVKIWSPDVYNAHLVDLPGLFVVASEDQADLPKKIKEISSAYVQDLNNIPIVVHAGPSDPATNQGIKMINKYRRTNDTFGVITKVDMLEKQNLEFVADLLNGANYPLGHGYCAVVLRNDREIEAGKSIHDKIDEEKQFFKKIGLSPGGVPTMRKMISDIQFGRIKDQIPFLLSDIENQMFALQNTQSFISNLTNDNPKKLASNIRSIIEKLVGSSIDRADFEDKLKNKFREKIGEHIDGTIERKQYDKPWLSEENINSNILSYNRYENVHPAMYEIDGIKEIFSYGLISPIFLDNQTIKQHFKNELCLSTTVPIFEPYIDDPLGKKRIQWNKKLNSYFSKLLSDDKIHKIIHDVTQDLLFEYVCFNSEGQIDELTKQFAEYMIHQISDEAYESEIKYSITAMLNLEKRPQVSIFEIVRYISQMHPKYLSFHNTLFNILSSDNNKKIRLEIYGDEWNEAYFRVVSDNLVENCYRNVAVNLLDRMVDKLLEFCFDMFNKDHIEKEQNKINEKLIRLKEIKEIIQHFSKNKTDSV